MENEIKVGDYCRTSAGKIFKCSEIVLGNIPKDENKTMIVQYIVKHSPNLIDLIQCGDYVNGEQVCKSRYDELYTSYVYCGGIGVRTIEAYPTFIKDMKEEDIETIVTKEMMESISYKVKQEEN